MLGLIARLSRGFIIMVRLVCEVSLRFLNQGNIICRNGPQHGASAVLSFLYQFKGSEVNIEAVAASSERPVAWDQLAQFGVYSSPRVKVLLFPHLV